MDRNITLPPFYDFSKIVALRKESVDRNLTIKTMVLRIPSSLSARRAWIEILCVVSLNYKEVSRSPQGERG